MTVSTWTRRGAVACCGAALTVLAMAPIASAQTTTPAPVAPITLSPEESQQVCNEWVPKLTKRTANLAERINGGAHVAGSVANLKAKAADQRAKGHTEIADRLQKRADKRAGRIGDLNSAKQRLDTFTAAHCKPAGPAK
jgi:hypothetical protein